MKGRGGGWDGGRVTLIFTQTKFICFKVKLRDVYSKELKSEFKQIFVHPVHSSTVHSSQKV